MTAKRPRKLLTEERRREIVRIVETDGRAMVEDLVQKLGVSAVTIRGDLDALARTGALVRSHGGAVRPEGNQPDFPISLKGSLHRTEKVAIAKAAVDLIEPGQTIILDSGTTTAEIARQIKLNKTPLTVITNALNVALELAGAQDITLIMLGGVLRSTSSSMVGPQAERALRDFTADHLFLGVDGIDLRVGICTPDVLEAQLNHVMIEVSHEVSAVADFSKFGRRSLSIIGQLDRVNRIITDSKANPQMVESIRGRDVEVVIA